MKRITVSAVCLLSVALRCACFAGDTAAIAQRASGSEPSIEFTYVPPFGSSNDLTGRVANVVFADYRVAAHIFVGGAGWWTKPTFEQPLTPIGNDGVWQCDITTGGADPCATMIAAFLVAAGYAPPPANGNQQLPDDLFTNAAAWTTVTRAFPRALHFSGYDWTVKTSCGVPVGPGSNYFSDSASNVWVDAQDRLHLRITQRAGRWECAELVSTRSFGYGTYRFYLDSPVDSLDRNVVLGLFTWSDDPAYAHREIDIECTRWGDAADTNNSQYVVQPYPPLDRRLRFRVPPELNASTHSFTWSTDQVFFVSHAGQYAIPPAPNQEILHWTWSGSDVPLHGDENVRLNLWLSTNAPASGAEVEVVLNRFVFVPLVVPAPTISAVQSLPTGAVQLDVEGDPQLSYTVQASTNLLTWTALTSIVATNGTFEFVDTNVPAFPYRFYRITVPPQ